jgi:hypothetical protein
MLKQNVAQNVAISMGYFITFQFPKVAHFGEKSLNLVTMLL